MKKNNYIILLLMCLFVVSCQKTYTPKPYGYVRIDIPQIAYTQFNKDTYPYTFNVSQNAEIKDKNDENELFWIDIHYPQFNADIHCSYKKIKNNFSTLALESEKFVYKHAQIANAIPEQGYENPEEHIYGVLYEIQGNTASPYQFVLTDSINHFFRGALYFNCAPNQDSLSPVIDYMRYDIIELIESFRWQ